MRRRDYIPSAIIAILTGSVLLLASCERQSAPASIASSHEVHHGPVDYVAHPVVDDSEITPPGLRIVSAAPSITEMCCALGLRGNLCGRTRYCDYPKDIEKTPSIGALNDMNIEALLELRPDLILVSGRSRAQIDRLAPLGLRVESVPDARLEDLYAAIARIGELTGRTRTGARLCENIREDLQRITERYAGSPRRRVLVLTGTLNDPPRPPYAAGPDSFYDALIRRAGHENVVTGEQDAYAPLSLEYIVQADPDVVIELDADGTTRPNGDVDAAKAWGKLGRMRAAENGRIHVLTGNQYFLLGPRITHTYAAFCRAINGETDGPE